MNFILILLIIANIACFYFIYDFRSKFHNVLTKEIDILAEMERYHVKIQTAALTVEANQRLLDEKLEKLNQQPAKRKVGRPKKKK